MIYKLLYPDSYDITPSNLEKYHDKLSVIKSKIDKYPNEWDKIKRIINDYEYIYISHNKNKNISKINKNILKKYISDNKINTSLIKRYGF